MPLSWSGSKGELPSNYSGYLLVFNEPDNREQGNLKPILAASQIKALQYSLPNAKLIVSGVTQFGTGWLDEFGKNLGDYKPVGYHIHSYIFPGTDLTYIQTGWFPQVRHYCNGEIWLTEFADLMETGKELLEFVVSQPWITRYAWFANRMIGNESWYPKGWPNNPSLINKDGELTSYGKLYTSPSII